MKPETTEVPAYLFDLIKLSILSLEGNREAMAAVAEAAIQKGAESWEIKRAMFRAEKMAQRTIASSEALISRGIERLTAGANLEQKAKTTRLAIKLLTAKKTI